MTNKTIPNGVREWLEFGMDPALATIETKDFSEIEGASIITGVAGNGLTKKVQDYAQEHSDEDYFAVVNFNNREEWGSMAISFPTREEAQQFKELVSNCGGHLRLSSGKENGWFLYEAE